MSSEESKKVRMSKSEGESKKTSEEANKDIWLNEQDGDTGSDGERQVKQRRGGCRQMKATFKSTWSGMRV